MLGPVEARVVAGEADAILEAAGTEEMPDPGLPSPWSLRRSEVGGVGEAATTRVNTVLDLLAWVFLIWLGSLLVRRRV